MYIFSLIYLTGKHPNNCSADEGFGHETLAPRALQGHAELPRTAQTAGRRCTAKYILCLR